VKEDAAFSFDSQNTSFQGRMKELQLQVQDEDDGNRAWKFVLAHWKSVVKSREHNRKCFKRGEVCSVISAHYDPPLFCFCYLFISDKGFNN
jgi:hypothetical protein